MFDKGDELKDRIEARRHELLSRYNDLKADTRSEVADTRARVKARLEELDEYLKSGWHKVNAEVRSKLSRWLERED